MKLRHSIGQVRAFLRPYPHVLPVVALLGTIAALAEGFSIGLMIPFLASLMDNQPTGGGVVAGLVESYAALFPEDWRLVGVSVSVIGFVIASCVISYGYIWLLTRTAAQVTHDLRTALFRRFFETDDTHFAEGSQGRQIKAIDGTAHRAGQAAINLCLLVASAATSIVFCVVLVLISWRMTFLIVAGIMVVGLVIRLVVRRGMAVSRDFEARSSILSDTALQVLSGLRMVRIFGQEARECAQFEAESDAVRQAEGRLEGMRRAMAPLIDGLTVPVLIAALVIAFYAGVSATILLPFLFLCFRLQRYLRECEQAQVRLAADAGSVDEISTLLAPLADHVRRPQGDRPFDRLQTSIRFQSVSFSHASRGGDPAPSLRDVTLEVRRGETLGIVGASGSGKSTLINLLVGLHVPDAGRILIDDTPLAEIDLAQWRGRLGFAGQDAELRTGTIAANIAYGKPGAGHEEIVEAAHKAHILPFIESLPSGFQTAVGARGLQLSGGERQRIALARALLRAPDILILDEATNAVDNTSEAVIRAMLEDLKGRLTMIVIAHRLSSIRHADRVIVMQAGRIIESGRPEDLLRSRGAFAELSGHEMAAQ